MMIGKAMPNEERIPQLSATKPKSGGPIKNIVKEICASEATLIVDGRSVRWAAADMASGKIALVPIPIMAKPSSEMTGAGDRKTVAQPRNRMACRTLATDAGECLSTKPSTRKRAEA